MQIIAWHLPQFHEIPENNEWHGEGFTEWTNIKKARPLFKGHYQPRVPLTDNYYNLLEKETMRWQCELSQQFGIDAFCYYHYWFDGKLLLEKPLENLLEWKDIPQKFCISWANEPWKKTWSGDCKVTLVEQIYSGEEGFKKHFDYVVKFFLDDRYIKVENKPVFVIYRTENIPDCDIMIEKWNKWSREIGFDGIYFIETLNSWQSKTFCKNSDAYVKMRPTYPMNERFFHKVKRKLAAKLIYNTRGIAYTDRIYRHIISDYKKTLLSNRGKESFDSGFVSWDNSPRKGSNSSIFLREDPAEFENFMTQMLKTAIDNKSKFLFFNAWNEWCEGTYLEPDQKYGYQYLEALKRAKERGEK